MYMALLLAMVRLLCKMAVLFMNASSLQTSAEAVDRKDYIKTVLLTKFSRFPSIIFRISKQN